MTKSDIALERVHELYLTQMDLIRALGTDLSDPKARKDVRVQMKRFESLLARADHRYMGGEDVLESMKTLPKEMMQKLKMSPVAATRKRVVVVKKKAKGKSKRK